MALDIFVNPTLPEEDGDPRWLAGGYEDFRASISQKIGKSALPITIGYDLGHPSSIQDRFIHRYEDKFGPEGVYTGGVNSRGDFTSFLFGDDLRLVIGRIKASREEEVRIHGGYIGYGLSGAAIQIASALDLGKSLFTSPASINESTPIADGLVESMAFEPGKVKYGDVLVYPNDNDLISIDPLTSKLNERAAKELPRDAQFVDDQTQLFFMGD